MAALLEFEAHTNNITTIGNEQLERLNNCAKNLRDATFEQEAKI